MLVSARASVAATELRELASRSMVERKQLSIVPWGTAESAFYARFAVLNLITARDSSERSAAGAASRTVS